MDGERVVDSLWWEQLCSLPALRSELCRAASSSNYIVCVPQTASLAAGLATSLGLTLSWSRGRTSRSGRFVLSKADAEAHILVPTAVRGEFECACRAADGAPMRVSVQGSQVLTRDGFADPVAARVLDVSDLTIPDSGGLRVRVYFLSRPLRGGVSVPSHTDDIDHGGVRSTLAMLKALPEVDWIWGRIHKQTQAAATQLQRSTGQAPEAVSAVLRDVAAALTAACREAVDALMATSVYEESPGSARMLTHVITSFMIEPLSPALHVALGVVHASAVSELLAYGSRLGTLSPEQLGVKREFVCDPSPVLASLCLLSSAATPLEKLHIIRDAYMTLVRCVERSLEAQGVDLSTVDMATDDVLDMLVFSIVKACAFGFGHDISSLPVHLAFIEMFHFHMHLAPGEFAMSRLGFHYATLAQAVEFFHTHAAELVERHADAAAVPEAPAASTVPEGDRAVAASTVPSSV